MSLNNTYKIVSREGIRTEFNWLLVNPLLSKQKPLHVQSLIGY